MGRYVPNPRFLDQLSHSPEMRAFIGKATSTVEQAVIESAPIRTGRYRGSIRSTVVATRDGWKGMVGSTSPFWHLIEFGSANNPAYAPLRRGLERALSSTRRIGRSG